VSRLIDVPAGGRGGLVPLVVQVGDVLAFAASGVRLDTGPPVLESLGPLLPAIVGLDGRVLAPAGAPSAVLLIARAPGRATLTIVAGDPWHAPVSTPYTVDVEG
jgi:hypothetical protein